MKTFLFWLEVLSVVGVAREAVDALEATYDRWMCVIFHLWHTRDPILSSGPTPTWNREKFILGFSPSETLTAFVRYRGDVVIIVDLQSGGAQLTIDMGLKVICLGMTRSTIVVAGREEVVTWNLTAGNTRAEINDSIRITTFNSQSVFLNMLISPDLSCIAILAHTSSSSFRHLEMSDAPTGRLITSCEGALHSLSALKEIKVPDILSEDVHPSVNGLRFAPDDHEIWGLD